jgi:hypothetical protein
MKIIHHVKNLHKIKVHHNRWLIWTVVFIFVTMVGLLGYIQYSGVVVSTPDGNAIAPIKHITGELYQNNYLGFSVYHPEEWGVAPEPDNTISFYNPKAGVKAFSVKLFMSSTSKDAYEGLENLTAKTVMVNGEEGSWYKKPSPNGKDYSTIVVERDTRTYVLEGQEPYFFQTLETFKFEKPLIK